MREVRQAVPQHHRGRHAYRRELVPFELAEVVRRALGALVEGEVDQRAGHVLDRLETLVELRRAMDAFDEFVGYGRTGLHVPGVAAQDLGLEQPVLEQLRRQFHEVAEHIGPCKPLVRRRGEKTVKAMAELVEERAGIVEAQQRGPVAAGLREVVVVRDDRQCSVTGEIVCAQTIGRHPCTAPLRGPRVVVREENATQRSVRIAHLERAHIGVVGGNVRSFHEGKAEEALSAVESCAEHGVQREVRLHLLVVELVPRSFDALRVVSPVPGLDLGNAINARRGAELFVLGDRRRPCRNPHLCQQVSYGISPLRHRVRQLIVRERGVAVKTGEFESSLQNLADQRTIVGRSPVLPTPHPGVPCKLSEVATGREHEERRDQRPRDREGVAAFGESGILRGAGH